MAGDGPALELDGLHKVFGDLVAVDHLDLTVPAGSFFGLVGRNGAGKTTTLRMCTALLRPDDGSVRIDGVDVWADPQEAKRRMGVMPESMDVFDRLTGAELLLYDGLLRGMDRDLVVERSTELLDVLELTDAAARTVADYSHGMTKKIVLPNGKVRYEISGTANKILSSLPTSALDSMVNKLFATNRGWLDKTFNTLTGVRTMSIDQEREFKLRLQDYLKDKARSGQVGETLVYFARKGEGDMPEDLKVLLASLGELKAQQKKRQAGVRRGFGF